VFGQYNRQFAPTRTGADWLSRDPAEVDAYLRDPLCNFAITAQAWVDFLEGKAAAATTAAIARVPKTLPLFLIAGTSDAVGENRKGVERLLRSYTAAGLTRVSHRFYDGARHELVNETNREEVTGDVIAWIDGVLAGT
jgi:alpha-beta hydrolase superfamily lysophospholipase